MKVLVIPGCDDTNRGDQALIWESVRIAKDAGLNGEYYMISNEACAAQSKKEGIGCTAYILPHPSVHFKELNDNRTYTLKLKLLWGMMALGDLCTAVPLLYKPLRGIWKRFLASDKKRTLQLFEQADAAIVKGGGFLHAKSGIAEAYKIYFFLYHIKLAVSMGIPVLVMPNSYGSFDSKITRKMIRKTLKKSALLTARESVSHEVLKSQCALESWVTMDLGAYLEKDEELDALGYLRQKNIVLSGHKNVVITARPYRFPGKDNPEVLYKNYIESIVSLIVWLSENGYYPVLAEHVYSDNYHESDIKAIEDIKDALSQRPEIKFGMVIDHSLNCRDLKSIYSCFDYMIGTRFHSVIFALFSNVPSIAITYGGNKGIGIMRDLGISEYTIGIDKVSETDLIDKFKRLVDKRDEYLDLIKNASVLVQEQRKELIQLVKQNLKE